MNIIQSLIDRMEHDTAPEEEQAMDYQAGEGKRTAAAGQESRAASVSLADFSEQLTSGVLRAFDERAARSSRPNPEDPTGGGGGRPIGPPWIWCGYWIRLSDIQLDRDFENFENKAFGPE
jgi:hypothetical protein